MKKYYSVNKYLFILLSSAVAMSFTSCGEDDPEPEPEPEVRVLTFENADYRGTDGPDYWTSLIDSPQYGGPLLYADPGTYSWYDQNNTELSCSFTTPYWNGGEAISNYVLTDFSNATYQEQLAVPVTGGGHNGSKNFCVHNGYFDENSFKQELPVLSFKDGQARVIDHMYVVATSYLAHAWLDGDSYNPKPTKDSWFKISATGYDAQGNETGTCTFDMCKGTSCTMEWTKWDLSSLGAVAKIELNCSGSEVGQWGLNTPAYFAYDDIAIIF